MQVKMALASPLTLPKFSKERYDTSYDVKNTEITCPPLLISNPAVAPTRNLPLPALRRGLTYVYQYISL